MKLFLFAPDPELPRYTTTLRMAGRTWTLRMSWNSRTNGWYMDAFDEEGTEAILGERISVGSPIAFGSSTFTPTFIAAGRDDHTDYLDWARRRMVLFYVEESG